MGNNNRTKALQIQSKNKLLQINEEDSWELKPYNYSKLPKLPRVSCNSVVERPTGVRNVIAQYNFEDTELKWSLYLTLPSNQCCLVLNVNATIFYKITDILRAL